MSDTPYIFTLAKPADPNQEERLNALIKTLDSQKFNFRIDKNEKFVFLQARLSDTQNPRSLELIVRAFFPMGR